MASKSNNENNGIGLMGFIFIIFLILKLAKIGDVAYWSWIWVFSPLWIPLLLGIFILGVVALIGYYHMKNKD